LHDNRESYMPFVTISMISGRNHEEKRAISDAVRASLVDAFMIPDGDYNHRIAEYGMDDFILPEGKTEKFVLVEFVVFPGRSREAKKRLYGGIVTRLGALGIPAGDALVVLNEPPLVNWGIRGGVPADEADRGFRLDV
jgi:phenylpyruvate tautomerase PptA (4-oxalocrotonate tautomerase family)